MLNFAAGKTKSIVRRLDLIYKLSIIACISVYFKTNIYVITVLNPSCFTSFCKCRHFFYTAK